MPRSADATPRQRATGSSPGRLLAITVTLLAVCALVAAAGGTAAADTIQQDNQSVDYSNGAQFEFASPQLAEMPFGPETPIVELGDDYGVGTTVTNAGDEAGTRPVVFAPQVSCTNIPDGQLPVAQRLVELDPGESTDVSFYCDVPADGEPTTNDPLVGVRNVAGEATVLSPSATYDWDTETYPNGFEIVQPRAPPSVGVEGVSIDASPQVGVQVTVAAAVNNSGGPGSTSVALAVEGEEVDRVDGEMDRGARSAVPLTYTPEPGEWGTQNWTVTTDDDSATGTVEVAPQPFAVEIADAPATGSPGETVDVDVRVTNEGNARDVHPVALEGGGTATDGTLVGLDPGSSTTVTLTGTVGQDATGSIDVSAVGPTDSATTTMLLTDTTGVDVAIEDLRDPVMHAAETITVEASVSNAGSSAVTRTVDLSVDGTTAASTDVDVPAGETTTVSLSGAIDPTVGETHSVSVATDGASDSQSVDVAPPLDVTLPDGNSPAPAGEDGLYRDVDGDGAVGQTDVAVLFNNMIFPEIDDNGIYFDYTGDGAFGQLDVAQLFHYIALN